MAGAAKGIRAGQAFVELGVHDTLRKGLENARKHLRAWGAAVTAAGMKITGIGAAAVGGFAAASKVFAGIGDQLDKMAIRTGMSVEALSELGYAASLSGSSLEDLEGGVRIMQRNLSDAASGSETAAEAFGQLGLSVRDLRGLSPEEQFERIADRISSIQDPAMKAGAAMAVFGKSGTKLLPLMQDGASGIRAMRTQARELGLTMSTEAAKDAARLNDAMDMLWKVMRNTVAVVGSALAPTLADLGERAARVAGRVSNWIKQNKALVLTVAKVSVALLGAGIALVALGYLISGLGAAIGGFMAVVSAVGAVLGTILSPVGLVIGAVIALGGALLYFTDVGGKAVTWLGSRFGELWGWVSQVIGGISDALASGDIALAAKVLWAGLKVAWETGIAALNRAWLEGERWFLTQFYQMWSGAQSLIEFGWHGIKVGWVETTNFLSRTWERFTTGLAKGWEIFSSWFSIQWATIKNIATKTWNHIKGLWDEGFNVEAANEAADQALVAAEQNIEKQRDANLKRISEEHKATMDALEKDRQARRAAEQQRHEDRLRGINEAEDRSIADLDKATDEKLARSRGELEAARSELDDALTKAREKRATFADAGAPNGGSMKKVMDEFDGLGATVAKKLSVTGTFNAVAASGLGTGGSAAERTAKATEQTAQYTRRLVEKANTGQRFT